MKNDITGKLLARASQSSVFKMAVQSAFNHIIITDAKGKILFANQAVERITGYSHDEIIGNNPRLWGNVMNKTFYKNMWSTLVKKKSFTGEIQNKRKNGQLYYAKVIISPILDDEKTIIGFVGTEEDITMQKEIDKMKSEFISIAAHQLRTPLTSINWSMDILKDTSTGKLNTKQKDLLKDINNANQRLIGLVNMLLNISRIESGRFSVVPKMQSVPAIMQGMVKQLEPRVKEKQQKIAIKRQTGIPKMNVDGNMIAQVFQNILTNAIKYSPKGGKISVDMKVKGKFLLCSISDTGMGIPNHQQDRIFMKFFRADNAVKEEVGGNGLGLYFVNMIVEACKGTITFKSKEGEGTTFTVALPLTGMSDKEGEVRISLSQKDL